MRRAPNRRRRNHQAAADGPVEPTDVPDHPLVPAGKPVWVDTAEQLAEVVDHARAAGSCGYDTEFIGESSYYPELCLIQLGTVDRVAVIDAMAGLDLAPIWRLLADPAVRKIVHAGGQDLEPAARHIGRTPVNVFDTQVAAGFIGLPYPLALSKLADALLGLRLGKGLTYTSWDERPLTNAHLRYAADDVRYLPALHRAMAERLEDTGHAEYAARECAQLCEDAARPFDATNQLQRMRQARPLSAKKRAVLRELLALRDEGARAYDLPPRSFLKDQVLLELTRRSVASEGDLRNVKGLPRPVLQSHGARIIEATRRALDLPKEEWPAGSNTEESAHDRFRINSLWAVVQAYCLGRGIDYNLVASRQDVFDYHAAVMKDRRTPPLRITRGWRGDLLGELLDDFAAGRRAVSLDWADDRLRSHDATR